MLILTHDVPDPDAIGSACALQLLARKKFNIRSKIVYGGIIGRMENRLMIELLKLPVHPLKRTDLKKHHHVALVDTQPCFRNNPFPCDRRATIVIDQHGSSAEPNTECFIFDPGCGATCVILAQALLIARIDIPPRIATVLAYGIMSDTLNFFRSRRPDVIQTYLDILPHCDMSALSRIQNPALSKHFFTTMARGIDRARSTRDLIVSHLGVVEDPDAVAQVADLLLSYKGIHWSLCTGRYRSGLRLSLRAANARMSASDILQDVTRGVGQAGGHDTVAGGVVDVGAGRSERAWRLIENNLVKRLMKKLHISTDAEIHRPFH